MIPALLPLALVSIIFATPLAAENTRKYTVFNRCPTTINLYIGGEVKESTIQTNESVSRTLGTDAGFFYTDANGGNPNGVGSIRVGFYNDFYYMVSDPNHANTGVRVTPSDGPSNGYCEAIECDGRGCPQAFPQPPTTFPVLASSPRVAPPYYRCPFPNTGYNITFCPTGQFANQGQPIHFNFYKNKCLEVQGSVLANGTAVQIYDCNGLQGQHWLISRGSTRVQVAGTNFCLDGDAYPENGAQLKIQQCADTPAQHWYYTNDNRIALEDQGFCTDLEDGNSTNTGKVQTWTCTDDNDNQVWTL